MSNHKTGAWALTLGNSRNNYSDVEWGLHTDDQDSDIVNLRCINSPTENKALYMWATILILLTKTNGTWNILCL